MEVKIQYEKLDIHLSIKKDPLYAASSRDKWTDESDLADLEGGEIEFCTMVFKVLAGEETYTLMSTGILLPTDLENEKDFLFEFLEDDFLPDILEYIQLVNTDSKSPSWAK